MVTATTETTTRRKTTKMKQPRLKSLLSQSKHISTSKPLFTVVFIIIVVISYDGLIKCVNSFQSIVYTKSYICKQSSTRRIIQIVQNQQQERRQQQMANTFRFPMIFYVSSSSSSSSSSRLKLSSTSTFQNFDGYNDNLAQGLLYKEQEMMLQKRGQIEEELMKDNYTPIQTYPVPKNFKRQYKTIMTTLSSSSSSSASKGGFSTGTSSSSSKKKKTKKSSSTDNTETTSFSSLNKYDIDSSWYSTILQEQGVVRIDNVLPDDLFDTSINSSSSTSNLSIVDELRKFVLSLRDDSIQKVMIEQTVPKSERFADVLLKSNRCDLKIPLMGTGTGHSNFDIINPTDPNYNSVTMLNDRYNIHSNNTNVVEKALHHSLTKSPIPGTIQKLFDMYNNPIDKQKMTISSSSSSSPVLYELSTLISDPGSFRQNIHPDNPIVTNSKNNNDVPVLLTCFIALQDVTIDMGPTVWLPGTHTEEYHTRFFQEQPMQQQTDNDDDDDDDDNGKQRQDESPKDYLLRTHPAVIGTLPKGCCAIYDSRILHCGSANTRIPIVRTDDNNNNNNSNDESSNVNSRAIFYFSFRNPTIPYPGNPASIRTEIGQEKVTLLQLQHYLEQAVIVQEQQLKHSTSSSVPIPNPFPWNR